MRADGTWTAAVTLPQAGSAGMAILSFVRPDGSFVVDVLPASLIAAARMALPFIPR